MAGFSLGIKLETTRLSGGGAPATYRFALEDDSGDLLLEVADYLIQE